MTKYALSNHKASAPPKSWKQYYSGMRRRVEDLGFLNEIEWQQDQQVESITESAFLREAAWVVMCSGFRESTVRRCFDYVSLCFCDWESAQSISTNASVCVDAALHGFRNRAKMEALATIAKLIARQGFDDFFRTVANDYVTELQRLPFIGPVTALHLAKNLGFEIAKPDRHLVRLSDNLGFRGVDEMCETFSNESGDPVRVVDIVLWRYCEQNLRSVFCDAEVFSKEINESRLRSHGKQGVLLTL